jgi:glutathione reductase (NADPH)
MNFDYDLFVIGAGSAGSAAAQRAAAYGARVAVAEQEAVGGTCVNRGCIPKKLIVYAADFALQDRVASSYGWKQCQRQLDWSHLNASIHKHVERINQSYIQKFQQAGIELIRGHATFVNPQTVEIEGRKVTANKILIAVGGHPLKPKIQG